MIDQETEDLRDELYALAAEKLGCDEDDIQFRVSLNYDHVDENTSVADVYRSMIALLNGKPGKIPDPKPLSPEALKYFEELKQGRG